MFSIFKKYITDFIAGLVSALTVFIGSHVAVSHGTLADFEMSLTAILVALVASLFGGTVSVINTKLNSK